MASARSRTLLHRSSIINIRCERYRLKEKRQAKTSTTGGTGYKF
jgi:hypothetical protein